MSGTKTQRVGHCDGCGAEVVNKTDRGPRKRWCSEACRRKYAYAGGCIDCGAQVTGRGPHAKRKRCQKCANDANARARVSWREQYEALRLAASAVVEGVTPESLAALRDALGSSRTV